MWNGAEGCEHEWGGHLIPKTQSNWDSFDTYRNPDYDEPHGGKTGKGGLSATQIISQGQFCQRCGAWRGSFGNEPNVALFIAHLMEFMAAILRVLKDTGVAYINLSDSYIGGKGQSAYGWASEHLDRPTLQKAHHHALGGPGKTRPTDLPQDIPALNLAGVPQRFFLACQEQGWIVRSEIILAKDSPMPESLRGWRWERCRVKVGTKEAKQDTHNGSDSLPEGRHGLGTPQWADCPGCEKCEKNGGLVLRKGSWRPTSSHEKLFMLTKGGGYFSDGEDVRVPHKEPQRGLGERERKGDYRPNTDDPMVARWVPSVREYNPAGANLRDVWPMKSSNFTMQLCKACKRVYTGAQFGRLVSKKDSRKCHCAEGIEGWQPAWIETLIQVEYQGLEMTEQGWQCGHCGTIYDNEAWLKLPQVAVKICRCGASDWLSHFAAFHPSLPTTCILASTSAKGNCSKCGMPFVRVIERNSSNWEERKAHGATGGALIRGSNQQQGIGMSHDLDAPQTQTLGWKPSCQCGAEPEPAVVLDLFSGTASTGVAAKRLGRRYVGIDLSEDYLRLSAARLQAETSGML